MFTVIVADNMLDKLNRALWVNSDKQCSPISLFFSPYLAESSGNSNIKVNLACFALFSMKLN